MNDKVGLADALTLIPEFSGEEDSCREIKLVYFREGCNDAVRVLDCLNTEKVILTFLKNKLTGDASQRFSLKLPTYLSVKHFLDNVKKAYDLECDNVEFWVEKMKGLKSNISMKEYSANFQELFQCTILGIQSNTIMTESEKKEKIKQLEDITTSLFIAHIAQKPIMIGLEKFVSIYPPKKRFLEVVYMAMKCCQGKLYICHNCGSKYDNKNTFNLTPSHANSNCCNNCLNDNNGGAPELSLTDGHKRKKKKNDLN